MGGVKRDAVLEAFKDEGKNWNFYAKDFDMVYILCFKSSQLRLCSFTDKEQKDGGKFCILM